MQYPRKYRKIPIKSPGLTLFRKHFFWRGGGGVIFTGAYFRGGAYYRDYICVYNFLDKILKDMKTHRNKKNNSRKKSTNTI